MITSRRLVLYESNNFLCEIFNFALISRDLCAGNLWPHSLALRLCSFRRNSDGLVTSYVCQILKILKTVA